MEHITRERTWPQWESRTPTLHLPLFLRVVFIMVTGFTAVSIGAQALGQYAVPPPNPFAAYADVFPGQSRSAIEARGFSCPARDYGGYYGLSDEHCTLSLANGAFSSVGVVVSNDTIHQISFTMRDNTLRVGDLVALWGRPEAHEHRSSAYLFWPNYSGMDLTVPYAGPFSFFLPVRSVYIANPPTKTLYTALQ